MPLAHGYAVLKGHLVRGIPAPRGDDHYSARVVDDHTDYRVAINIRSSAAQFGSDLWFYLDENFRHPILAALQALPLGRRTFAPNASVADRRNSHVALDFIRMNLFDRSKMKVIPAQLPGPTDEEDLHRLRCFARSGNARSRPETIGLDNGHRIPSTGSSQRTPRACSGEYESNIW